MIHRLLLIATVTALAGAITSWLIFADAIGGGYEAAPVYAALSSALTVAPLWYLLIERRQRYSAGRGAMAGALTGLLSHPLFWYLFILDLWVGHQLDGQSLSSLGEPPMDPLQAVAAALIYSLWSWLLFGLLTAGVGAVLGGVTAHLISRSIRDGKASG